MTREELEKYRKRLFSTMPLFGGWFRKKTAERLAEKAIRGDIDTVKILTEALMNPTDSAVQDIVGDALNQLNNSETIDVFCTHWAKDRAPALERILINSGYIAGTPPELRALTALKVGHIEKITNMGEEVLELLIKLYEDDDRAIAIQAGRALGKLQNPEAIEAFCEYIMIHKNSPLFKIALDSDYAPKDEAKRALFYFITEQWEKYDVLDFQESRLLLRRGYAQASEEIRRSFLEVARQSGKSNILSEALVGRGKRLRVGEMGNAEWETIVEGLKKERRWDEMWRLIFLAPVEWAAEMVLAMRDGGWKAKEEERNLWEELVGFCPKEGKGIILPDVAHIKTMEYKYRFLSITHGENILTSH